MLSQVVSPASSTYLYDLSLNLDRIDFRDNRPMVGVMSSVSGFSLVQVYVDEKCVVLKDRLTEEGARAVLEGDGYMEPLFVSGGMDGVGSISQLLKQHLVEKVSLRTGSISTSDQFTRQVLKQVGKLLATDTSDFRLVRRGLEVGPSPVYVSTARQVGLLPNDNIPQVVPFLLPSGCRAYCGKFLRKFLLSPPPYEIADRFRSVLRILTGGRSESRPVPALPSVHPVSVGKVVSLLSSGQCNAATFREIECTLGGVQELLDLASSRSSQGEEMVQELTAHLLALGQYESGVAIDQHLFAQGVRRTRELIRERIAVYGHHNNRDRGAASMMPIDCMSRDPHGRIPDEFFMRNELEFRGVLATGEK